jgi:hypothetical protein
MALHNIKAINPTRSIGGLQQWAAGKELIGGKMQSAPDLDATCIKRYYQVMRTTVDIQEPLLRAARKVASKRRMTLSELLEDALRAHLAAPPRKKVRPFKLYTVKGELLDPRINLDRISSLITADDESFYRGSQE